MDRRYPVSESREERWIEEQDKKETQNRVFLVIVLKGDTPEKDHLIGWMSIGLIHPENGTAVTGAQIGEKDCLGKGYGTEAKMLLLHYAFDTLNLRKIYSYVYAFNQRSIRYSEKCGYRLEAKMPKDSFIRGKYVDRLILAVYADQWRKLWAKTKKNYLPK